MQVFISNNKLYVDGVELSTPSMLVDLNIGVLTVGDKSDILLFLKENMLLFKKQCRTKYINSIVFPNDLDISTTCALINRCLNESSFCRELCAMGAEDFLKLINKEEFIEKWCNNLDYL